MKFKNYISIIKDLNENKKIDFITCGVGIDSGHVGPLLNFSTNNNLSLYKNKKIINEDIKKHLTPIKSSLGISNSLISSLMMNEFFQYKATGICNCLNKIISFDFCNYEVKYIDF